MKRAIFLILIVFLINSCAIVPLTGRKQIIAVPSSEIIPLAADNYSELIDSLGLSNNVSYQRMVKNVGERLSTAVVHFLNEKDLGYRVENYSWEYKVLDSDDVNAFCMPGGKIGFFEGIMPVCEDENGVAVVMSHEIAHAVALHANERMSQQLLVNLGGIALSEALKTKKQTTRQLAMAAFGIGSEVGVLLPYSRVHEEEADELGLYFMAMAGFDPRGAPVFWKRMAERGGPRPPEFLSTHPNPEHRIESLNKHMDEALKYYDVNR